MKALTSLAAPGTVSGRRARAGVLVSLALSIGIVGCGAPFHVETEPGHADIYVDGKYAGYGHAVVETNGVVFNTYHVEARRPDGTVVGARDVDVRFSERSALLFMVGLAGVIFFPLLIFLPAGFFTGDPSPSHVSFMIQEPPKVPDISPERSGEPLDRPVILLDSPKAGETFGATEAISVRGRARHWSGMASVRVRMDDREVGSVAPHTTSDPELAFEFHVPLPGPGRHVVRVVAQGMRGEPASEAVRVTANDLTGAPPPPEPVPAGAEDKPH